MNFQAFLPVVLKLLFLQLGRPTYAAFHKNSISYTEFRFVCILAVQYSSQTLLYDRLVLPRKILFFC